MQMKRKRADSVDVTTMLRNICLICFNETNNNHSPIAAAWVRAAGPSLLRQSGLFACHDDCASVSEPEAVPKKQAETRGSCTNHCIPMRWCFTQLSYVKPLLEMGAPCHVTVTVTRRRSIKNIKRYLIIFIKYPYGNGERFLMRGDSKKIRWGWCAIYFILFEIWREKGNCA